MSEFEFEYRCPAKINLELRVKKTRHPEWGNRHEIDTIYCGVELCDFVETHPRDEGTGLVLALTPRYGSTLFPTLGSPEFESNLVIRAARALAEACHVSPDARIDLTKRIPVAAGLGGGSSDAAGTLIALTHSWGEAGKFNAPGAIAPSWDMLMSIAAKLGADIPFFLGSIDESGLAHGTGYGEKVEYYYPARPTLPLPADPEWEKWAPKAVALAIYDDGLSTADVYRRFDEIGSKPGDRNDLQRAALDLHPRSADAFTYAAPEYSGVEGAEVFISGSGPTVAALCSNLSAARQMAESWMEYHAADRTEAVLATTRMWPFPTKNPNFDRNY